MIHQYTLVNLSLNKLCCAYFIKRGMSSLVGNENTIKQFKKQWLYKLSIIHCGLAFPLFSFLFAASFPLSLLLLTDAKHCKVSQFPFLF